jgi:hypothetical protein
MLDIGGYLTSGEFLSQLAFLISNVLSALFDGFLASLFGVSSVLG